MILANELIILSVVVPVILEAYLERVEGGHRENLAIPFSFNRTYRTGRIYYTYSVLLRTIVKYLNAESGIIRFSTCLLFII